MEERIIQLETVVTLQDETIRQLGEEIFRQQKEIHQLRKQFLRLEEKMNTRTDSEHIAGNEKPPHW